MAWRLASRGSVCLEIIERAGHNPHDEQTAEVMQTVRAFITAGA